MKDVIYYNLWGDKLEARQAALQDKLVIPVSDRQYVDPASNEAAFSASLQSFLRELQTSVVVGANYQRFLETRIKWLQNLHAGYLNRLSIDQTLTKDLLLASIDNWATKTKELLKSAVEQQEDAFFSPNNVPQNGRYNNPKGNSLWLDKRQKIFAEMMSTIDQSSEYLKLAVSQVNRLNDVPFSNYIKNRDKLEVLMSYFHERMDGKSGISACVYIEAGMEANIFYDRPKYVDVLVAFPKIGSRANYDKYTGSRSYITENWY